MEKSGIINALHERIDALEKWRAERKEPEDKKKGKPKTPPVDEEVCPVCGSDLLFVEEGVVYCPKCKQYFEHEEGE
jgi:RNA polymerase subunit RPABC4/transcription elongation factor Spt4